MLMSEEQVDAIAKLHHKINVFEEWMEFLVKKGKILIIDAIWKCKEPHH